MTITVYAFEDAAGNEFGTFTTQEYEEARDYARQNRFRIIGRNFVFSDWEALDDFTSTGTDTEDEEDEDDD